MTAYVLHTPNGWRVIQHIGRGRILGYAIKTPLVNSRDSARKISWSLIAGRKVQQRAEEQLRARPVAYACKRSRPPTHKLSRAERRQRARRSAA